MPNLGYCVDLSGRESSCHSQSRRHLVYFTTVFVSRTMSSNKSRYASIFAVVLIGLVSCSAQAAIVFDMSAGFDASNNPSTLGPWRYGSTPTLGGGLTLYSTQGSNPPAAGWVGAGSSNVLKNFDTLNNFFTPVSNVGALPQQILAHPGQFGEYAVLRFTAPSLDFYDIDVSFTGNDEDLTTTDVHVLVNNTSIFSNSVSSAWTGGATGTPGAGPSFSTPLPLLLSAGATIDFAVGFGGNDFGNDNTGIFAQVTQSQALPEMNAFVVIALGAVCIGTLRTARRLWNARHDLHV